MRNNSSICIIAVVFHWIHADGDVQGLLDTVPDPLIFVEEPYVQYQLL